MSSIGEMSSRVGANYEMEIPSSEKEEESGLDRVGLLPEGVNFHVLSFLDPQDLSTCSKVCRRWKELADADIFWRKFIEDKEIDFSGKSVKKYIAEQFPGPGAIFCRSYVDAMLRLEDFFRNIPEGQKGRFRVILSQPNEEITFEHGIVDTMVDQRDLFDRDPDFIKTCFLIHNKKDGVTYGDDKAYKVSIASPADKSLDCLTATKYKFNNGSDLKAKIAKYLEKFDEIIDENVKKSGNEPRKSLFKRVKNYCNEHRIITGVGVCIAALVSFFINNCLTLLGETSIILDIKLT